MDTKKLQAAKLNTQARIDGAVNHVLSARAALKELDADLERLDSSMGSADPGDSGAWSKFEARHRELCDRQHVARRRLDAAVSAERQVRRQCDEELHRAKGEAVGQLRAELRRAEVEASKVAAAAAVDISAALTRVHLAAHALGQLESEVAVAMGEPPGYLVMSPWAAIPVVNEGAPSTVFAPGTVEATLKGTAEALAALKWVEPSRPS